MVVSSISQIYAQNLFNNIFKPSVERGYIIDIGDSKDRVWSSIFEGGVWVDINVNQNEACEIHNVIIQASEGECESEWGTRTPHSYTQNNTTVTSYRCVKNDPIIVQTTEANCNADGVWSFGVCKVAGRTVHANESQCAWATKNRIRTEAFITASQRDPLFVRIAKLLLRITIALSVTFVLYNAILYALSFGDSNKTSTAQKKLLNIIIGVIIALSSVGIIYLIQSIITQTIRY